MATAKRLTTQELADKRADLEEQLRKVRQEIAARAGEQDQPADKTEGTK